MPSIAGENSNLYLQFLILKVRGQNMLGRGPGELLVEAAVVPGPEGEVLAEADETVLDTAPPAHLGHLVRAGERQPPGRNIYFTSADLEWT